MKLSKEQLRRIIKEEYRKLLNEDWMEDVHKIGELWNAGKGDEKNVRMVLQLLPSIGEALAQLDPAWKPLIDAYPDNIVVDYTTNLSKRWIRVFYESKETADVVLIFFRNYITGSKWRSSGMPSKWEGGNWIQHNLPREKNKLGPSEIPNAPTIEILAMMLDVGDVGRGVGIKELQNRGYVGDIPPRTMAFHEDPHYYQMQSDGSVKKINGHFELDNATLMRLQQEL